MDKYEPLFGDLEHEFEKETLTIKLGTIRYGQTYDIIVNTDHLSAPVLTYEVNGIQEISQTVDELQNPNFEYHNLRLESIQEIKKSVVNKTLND